jgi:hypothetical protein
MKKIYLLLVFVFIYSSSKAQLYYNFNNLDGAATSGVPTGYSASSLTANNTPRTTDFFTTTSASDTYSGNSGGGNITTIARDGRAGIGVNALSYFELTITPSVSEKVRVATIGFGSRSISSNGGPSSVVIRSSVDNYSAAFDSLNINSGAVWTIYNRTLSRIIIGAAGTPVTIRIYARNGTGSTTTNNWRIDDLNIGFVNRPVISNYLMAQNAWLLQGFYAGSTRFGQLNSLWPTVKASGVKMVRIGGIHAENNSFTASEAINLIDSIRKIGAEPMVQVATGRGTFTATQAADLVEQVNVVNGKNIKYWIIGNEPDLGSPIVNAAGVATYIKSYATAMKAKDPSILIVGPECAFYNSAYYPSLIGGANDITGKDANGRYYVDIISFHTYPFNGTQTRSSVITSAQNLSNNVDNLLALINNANTLNNRTGPDKLKWAITEFNVNYSNPTVNNVTGVGVHSFLNGQYWADVFNVGMSKEAVTIAPWCVQESGGNRSQYDLGYLDGSGATIKPRSSYYHEQMIADNIKGTYLSASNNQSLVTTFGSFYNDTTSIMIVNKALNNFNYALQLNDKSVTDLADLKINLLGDIDKLYTDQIDGQSTVVLVFNNNGILLKKIVYSLTDASFSLPPSITTYTLPLTWLDFNVKKEPDGSVNLSWLVSDQVNTYSFEVQRYDNIDFRMIGSKPSFDGKAVTRYNFTDTKPYNGTNYYRIKQIDRDGKFTYSKEVAVDLSYKTKSWDVYPNPVTSSNPKFYLRVNENLPDLAFKLVDLSGKILIEKSFKNLEVGQEIIINNNKLNTGIYVLQVNAKGVLETVKLISN